MKDFFMQTMAKKGARWVAFALACLSLSLAVFFTQGARYAWNRDWYTGGSRSFADSSACFYYVNDCNYYMQRYVSWKGTAPADVASGYGGSAYACRIVRSDTGEVLLDTTGENSVPVSSVDGSYFISELPPDLASDEPSDELAVRTENFAFYVEGYVNLPVEPYGGSYAEYRTHNFMLALSRVAIPMAILCYLLFAALTALLALRVLRWQRPQETSFLARIPADAMALGLALAVFLCLSLWSTLRRTLMMHLPQTSSVADALLYVLATPTLQTFLYTASALSLAVGVAEQVRQKALRRRLMLGRAPIFRRLGLMLCLMELMLLVLVLWISEWVNLFYGFSWLALAVMALGLVSLWLVYLSSQQMLKLRRAMERLAEGDLDSPIDSAALPPGLREQGEVLNRIGEGLQRAVEERLKGERFKTELITNVSHDLKTPLTSIVSYVDLLKKGDVGPEQAKEYIEVIERQSAKLKKLTEDLVEASKASSGVIEVHKEPVDVGELLTQSVGEFAKRLEDAGIEPVMSLPEERLLFGSDGRLLWRVLDNLIQNIVKYAQRGTRAYFDLFKTENGLVLELKNTSAEPLNIPADVLMERFIRGDSARHSEGSGLGLSIAQSFTELLGGKLELYLDGDLFKVTLRFESEE